MMYESFDRYVEYLTENKNRLPQHVFEFAIDVNRHNLNSPHSLHDAWMNSISIKENRNASRPFEPSPTIDIDLLGPHHDRDICLNYTDIESYIFKGIKNPFNWADTYHGDVLSHEVRLTESGSISHELLFASESKIQIVCRDFKCTERLYST